MSFCCWLGFIEIIDLNFFILDCDFGGSIVGITPGMALSSGGGGSIVGITPGEFLFYCDEGN